MALLKPNEYNENYFHDGGDIGGYTNYTEDSSSDETAPQLAAKFIDRLDALGSSIIGKKVLDVGCAHGFLVKHLVSLGVDAYGMDSSEYAISQVPAEISDRITLGNATLEADFQSAKTLAGLTKKNDKFDLILDINMVVCLNDADAKTFCDLAKKHSDYVIHYMENSPHISQWYNYHSIDEWRTLSGMSPKEKWYIKPSWLEN